MSNDNRSQAPFFPMLNKRYLGRFLNSGFADRLQTRLIRRSFAALYVFSIIGIGFFIFFLGSQDVVHALKEISTKAALYILLGALAFMPVGILVDTMFFMTIRSVMPVPGKMYDERQVRLSQKAHTDARYWVLAMMLVAVMLGVMQVPVSILAGVGISLLILSLMAPHFVLAWQLPDMQADDEDDGEEDTA